MDSISSSSEQLQQQQGGKPIICAPIPIICAGEGSAKPTGKSSSSAVAVAAPLTCDTTIGEDLQAIDGIDPDDVRFDEEEDDDGDDVL